MFFLTLSNADVQFAKKELILKTYTTNKALSTTRRVKLIDQKKFIKAMLDEKIKVFVMYISSLGLRMTMHLAREAQLALLLAKKVNVPAKYSDFANIFSKNSANILPKRTRVNEHAIELEEGKRLSYGPIYSLGPVKLKTLKTYIETNLANGFIKASKSPASTLILFVHKPNGNFWLCVDYRKLNNLMIKNWYLLPLISKFLDWLGWAKQFTQLDLPNADY